MNPGWTYCKSHNLTNVNQDHVLQVTLHYGSGTDSGQNVYLNSNCATGFRDIRFTNSDYSTNLNFWVERTTVASNAIAQVLVPSGTTQINLLYGGHAATETPFKICAVGDPEWADYDFGNQWSSKVSSFLEDWDDRMSTFQPDVYLFMGDLIQAQEATGDKQTKSQNYLQAFVDKMRASLDTAGVRLWVSGNHCFDYLSLNQFLDIVLDDTECDYYVASRAYGFKDVGDYRIVILDTNYEDATTHHDGDANPGGYGKGFVSSEQMSWLVATALDTTQKCIVCGHHQIAEMNDFWSPLDEWGPAYTGYGYAGNGKAVTGTLTNAGNVICYLGGHNHINTYIVRRGVPYIHSNGFATYNWGENAGDTYPARVADRPSDEVDYNYGGKWQEIYIRPSRKEIQVDIYEDGERYDSGVASGSQSPGVVRTFYVYYGAQTGEIEDEWRSPSNPYSVFAGSYNNIWKVSGFNKGETGEWGPSEDRRFRYGPPNIVRHPGIS